MQHTLWRMLPLALASQLPLKGTSTALALLTGNHRPSAETLRAPLSSSICHLALHSAQQLGQCATYRRHCQASPSVQFPDI
jgi:hypothetical protein